MFMLQVSVPEIMNEAKTNINNTNSLRMTGVLCIPLYVGEAVLLALSCSSYKCHKYLYMMSIYVNCFSKVQ